MSEPLVQASCSEQRYQVTLNDLPLSCPMPGTSGWDAHPRVFLDVAAKGEVACPYCGAVYFLSENN